METYVQNRTTVEMRKLTFKLIIYSLPEVLDLRLAKKFQRKNKIKDEISVLRIQHTLQFLQ